MKKITQISDIQLEFEHRKMVYAIAQLPEIPVPLKLWTDDQKGFIQDAKNRWKWIGLRIDYFQKYQLGYRPEDPIDDPLLHPLHKEYYNLISCWLFDIFNMLNHGFEHIRDASIQNGKDFPFQNPRELFVQVCRELSENGVKNATSRNINQGSTLNQVREDLALINELFRERLDEPNKKGRITKTQLLAIYQASHSWCEFWIYALFKHRLKPELRDYTNKFLRSHKTLLSFFKKSRTRGNYQLGVNKWNCGQAVDSATGKAVRYSIDLKSCF